MILRVRIPFSLSLVAIWACLAAVREPDELERHRAYISGERERLYRELLRRRASARSRRRATSSSWTCRVPAARARRSIEIDHQEGILIRAMKAHRLQGSHVRVTIGTREQNDRFLDVFGRAIGSGQVGEATRA